MNRNLLMPFLFLSLITLSSLEAADQDPETIYQTSRLDQLLAGYYDGKVPLTEVKKNGNFGLGTYDRLDGEMTLVDGIFYQVRFNGSVTKVPEKARTPFATVTFFDSDKTIASDQPMDLAQLTSYLDSQLARKHIFYAIRIDGSFSSVKARSVPPQKKPYPPLAEVIKGQSVFEFRDTKGTLIGFRCPETVKGVNVPGYHFHFLTEDKKGGGHLLDLLTANVTIVIDETPRHFLVTSQ